MYKIKGIGDDYQGVVIITSIVGGFFYRLNSQIQSLFESSGIKFPASIILSGTVVIVILGTVWSFYNWRKLNNREGETNDG